MPPASAGSGCAFTAGDHRRVARRRQAGCGGGRVTWASRKIDDRRARYPRVALPAEWHLGQPLVVSEIGETRHVGLELQLHRAGRAVALLADDDLGLAVHRLHVGLPLEMLFGPGARL